MLFHNYTRIQPRPAEAGFGFGPWLQPAFETFQIPEGAWLHVSDALMDRADKLLRDLIGKHMTANPQNSLYLVNTRSANLVLAAMGSSERSNDYQNEIHPTVGGYEKIAAIWRATMKALPGW